MNTVYFLVQQTMFFSIPLLIVALGGMFSERSGVVNIALEGIMIMGAFSSILFINIVQSSGAALPPQLLLLLAVLIAAAARNSRGAVAAFAWGRGVSSLGSTLGATLGVRANALAGMGTPLFDLFAAALILLFVGYALIGLRRFSFREVIDGVTPVETAVVEAPKATFDERCRALASQYSLTPRELEVFQMLARGRDRAYIQEQLVVSRNTVKAHVKHIYAKLDIHSHQDLIDLVEKG